MERHVVLCVAGGIAAYKSVELLRLLVKLGAQVQVAMTPSAQNFVGPLTFQTLSSRPVFTNLFDNRQDAEIGHIRIADGADLVIVAPATANLLGRISAGMANDPVAAAVMATTAPVLLAPSMNVNMWSSATVQANVKTLRERGMFFVGPDDGFLACKWTGAGRLSEPSAIAEAAACVLSPQDFAGIRVLVAAGGTEEAIDPVRFLGNRSTGKMGRALCRAAMRRGADVTLVAGPGGSCDRVAEKTIQVRSASEMCQAVLTESESADVVIMAAAVADYRPEAISKGKLRKGEWGDAPSIALVRTEDILATLGRERAGKRPFLVGFAAETENLVPATREKLKKKRCDMIVGNDVSMSDRGFGSDDNAVEIVCASGRCESLSLASKDVIAQQILSCVLREMDGQSA